MSQTTDAADPERLAAFRAAARAADMDPDNRWVGGYVEYERTHLARTLDAYRIAVNGAAVLELGCNVGASAVVMASMGARVTAVDIDAPAVAVAAANIRLHHEEDRADAVHVPDTRAMPLEGARFDLAVANSVLECADPALLPGILAELARVLRPGGHLFVCGTASRLAPYAVHDARWLVNYWPRWTDRLRGRTPFRGLSPRRLRRALGGRFEVVSADRWLPAREAVHGRASTGVRLIARAARTAGLAPGWISPTIELLLRRV